MGHGFDDVFADLVGHREELQSFLRHLQAQLPTAAFELHLENGEVLASERPLGKERELAAELFRKAAAQKELVSASRQGKARVYAVRVERLGAMLLFTVNGCRTDLAGSAWGRVLIRTCIDLALLREEHENLNLENQQIERQISVLNQQHGRLIEDNYRQYRLIRKKEKEYARQLESEIQRQTAELREANSRLEEASRLKSEFLANMSHELRTPLNAVIGFSELLMETGVVGEQEEYARTILSAANSLLVLINDILDLAKIEAGRVELERVPFALAEVASMVSGLFRKPARDKGVGLRTWIEPGLPEMVMGDANRLKQVLINLVGNSIKFTEQGEVELRLELAERREKEVAVRFLVRDTGIGIPPSRQKAVFEKFTQADGSTTRKFGGTGLGLTICRELVELMGGNIALCSHPGQGTTFAFTITLPEEEVERKAAASSQPARPDAGLVESFDATVLLVDDNPLNQRLASILISRQGCKVVVAADGLEALKALQKEVVDLVLMDFQMPRLDGLAATRKIREAEASPERNRYPALQGRTTPLPVIGLTAHARREDEQASYEAGMDGFLTKPIVKEKLAAVLREFLRNRLPFQSN